MEASLKTIIEASRRITPFIHHTPLVRAEALDEMLGCEVYLKLENLQRTGSFKIRGAMTKLLSLSEQDRGRGVIAASSGNHGQGVAAAANQLRMKAIIVVPEDINPVKLAGIQSHGAQVIKFGLSSRDRYEKVKELIDDNGYTLIHSFDDLDLIAGQGTIGLEIMNELPGIDTIICPLGGGGLLSGVVTAVKELNHRVKVIGVEPAAVSRYTQSLKVNKILEVDMGSTIADGLRVVKPGIHNFNILNRYLDQIALVEDEDIKAALGAILFKTKLLVEPSSAVGVAAALKGDIKLQKNQRVCFILSGGNIDIEKLKELL